MRTRDGAEHAKNEDQTRCIETQHQLAKRCECDQSVLAYRERHRAEGADWGDFHDDGHDPEQDGREVVDQAVDGTSPLA